MPQKLRRDEIESLWRDPASRKGWGLASVYYQPRDPRLVVPKKTIKLGWTINFAHPWAIPALILLMVCVPLPVLLTVSLALWCGLGLAASVVLVSIVEIVTIVMLCLMSSRQANRY
jgi:hypothetical protein